MDVTPVLSERLELVSMSPRFIEAVLGGRRAEAEAIIGLSLPEDWPGEYGHPLPIRLEQMRRDPATQPWLLRAIVLRGPERTMVGHINFHGPPDERGAVEVGYTILPAHRRRGYATEAVEALFAWATREHGITHFIASISPANKPSLTLARRLGFRQTGTQWDDEDGEELVFELHRPLGVRD